MHHPSLDEVLKESCNYEWLEANVTGFVLGDFADSENELGEISSPSFNVLANFSESEHGTYSFVKATINVELAQDNSLQNLEGEFPLGSINYYDQERTFITIRLSNKIYDKLMFLLVNNINNLCIKFALPVWDNPEVKCLPLLKYQITYKQDSSNGANEI